MMRMPRQWMWLVAVVGGAGALVARAADVKMQISSQETYVGSPVTARITIENAKNVSEPQVPDIPGVSVQSLGGPARSEFSSWVNGRTTRIVSISYTYQFTPHKAGTFTIPAIAVEADGRTFHTQPLDIAVTKSETGDLLFVELAGKRKSLYVGEPLDVTLRIWLRPFSDRQYNVKLSEGDMWQCIDLQASQWGVFTEVLQDLLSRRQRPRGRQVLRDDSDGVRREYYLYELDKQIWPQRAGQLSIGDLSVEVNYPVRLGRDRFSLLGGLSIAETRPIVGDVDVEPIEVKPIPTEDRPPYFEGAVGRYEISAAAVPTDVAVGEPITLTLTVTGTGEMETLPPPPLARIEDLTRDFKVPTDPLAGEVHGNAKQFTQSIRAKSEDVREIPAIPFVYFDPQLEQFVTTQSDPIPIKVKPAEKLAVSQIVDATGGGPMTQSLTEVSGGILANYTGTGDLLQQQAFAPGWPSAVALSVPPLLFVLLSFVQWRRQRLRNDPSLARRRNARRNALHAVQAATGNSTANAPAALATAVASYVADRCNLPPGGLTRAEVVRHLTQRGVPSATVDEVGQLLEQCEALQYSSLNAAGGDELAQAATRCITRLEKERL